MEAPTETPRERLDAFHTIFHLLFDDPEEAFLAASILSLHAAHALGPDRMKELLMNDGLLKAAQSKFGSPELKHDDSEALSEDELRLLRAMPRDMKKAS